MTTNAFHSMRWRGAAGAVAAAGSAWCAAQQPDEPPQTVTITATRIATPAFDVPASISLVTLSPDTDSRPGINLSEALGGVPGLARPTGFPDRPRRRSARSAR